MTESRRIRLLVVPLVLALGACGCANAPEHSAENPLERPPVDTTRVRSALEAAGWEYRQVVDVDLDGDTVDDRLTLASDVKLRPDGTPLWEDGHRWALWVETPTGERTLLYAAFVPHGFAEAGLMVPDDRGHRRVLVQERSSNHLNVFEVEYEGPDKARGRAAAHWQLEAWMQDLPQAQ